MNSIINSDFGAGTSDPGTTVVLDDLAPDHPLIQAYLDGNEGHPVFSKSNGEYLALDVPGDILMHCANLLGADSPLDFVRGVRQKLLKLAARWQ